MIVFYVMKEGEKAMTENILVVDDEQAITDLIEIYLENENYNVFKFYNGQDAMKCIESENLDLAILDIMLPDINGFTICQRIRRNHTFPVIMLTAKDNQDNQIMVQIIYIHLLINNH